MPENTMRNPPIQTILNIHYAYVGRHEDQCITPNALQTHYSGVQHNRLHGQTVSLSQKLTDRGLDILQTSTIQPTTSTMTPRHSSVREYFVCRSHASLTTWVRTIQATLTTRSMSQNCLKINICGKQSYYQKAIQKQTADNP